MIKIKRGEIDLFEILNMIWNNLGYRGRINIEK